MSSPQKYDAIIAFCEARIEAIQAAYPTGESGIAAVAELESVVGVCKSLNQQEALVANVIRECETRITKEAA